MKHTFMHQGQLFEIELQTGADGATLTMGDQALAFSYEPLGEGSLLLHMPDRRLLVHTAADREKVWVACEGQTYVFKRVTGSARRGQGAEQASEGQLRAPMPGQVRSVEAAPEDRVRKGDTLLVLEAMKMEIRIQAPFDGRVAGLPVVEGEQVEKEQLLVEITQETT